MKRLLMVAAAVAAGVLAKRAWEARHLPLSVARGDRWMFDEVDADRPSMLAALRGDDGTLGALLAFDDHVITSAEAALNRPLSDAAHTLAANLRDQHRQHRNHTRALVDRLGLELAQDAAAAEREADYFTRRAVLSREEDDDFEAEWLAAMVDEHEAMLDAIDRAIEEPASSDERIIEHLRLSRAHLEHHAAEARMLI